MNIWVVCADARRARIFTAQAADAPLQELEDLVHPEARLPDMGLSSDKPGRGIDRGGPGRHGFESRSDPREEEQRKFALALARKLQAGRTEGRFERLYVIAGPRFLGMLRKHLDRPTLDSVAGEIRKEITGLRTEEIRGHLPRRL